MHNKWTIDQEKKLYKYTANNLIQEFTGNNYQYILSMDLGWEDQNSFIIGAYHPNDICLYIIESFSESKMLLDVTINKINELEKKYKISHYLIDSANKQYVEELRYRTRKPFQAAAKTEKIKYIHMMNSDLTLRKIKIVEPNCQSLLQEWDILTKLKENTENYQVMIGNQPDHNADAALYLWRQSFHYLSQPEQEEIKTPEQLQDDWWDRQAQKLNRRKDNNFLENDWE